MLVLGVEEEIGIFAVLLVETADDLAQADIPDDEEKPVAGNQLSLPQQTRLLLVESWHLCDRLPMRSVLFQVPHQVLVLYTLKEVLEVVDDLGIDPQV